MRRAVNFRCFLISLTCVLSAVLLLCLAPLKIGIILTAVLAAALLALVVICALNGKAVACATFIVSFVSVASAFIFVLLTFNNWASELENGKEYYFAGKIDAVSVNETSASYVLSDVTADGIGVDGKLNLYVAAENGINTSFLKRGDRIYFKAEADFVVLLKDSPDGYAYRNDIRYISYAAENDIEFLTAEPDFFDNLRNSMSGVLDKNMGQYGALAFGMLTGEKGSLDGDVRDYYSASGLGHILAVSGLHVGFVALMVAWVTDRLRLHRYVKLACMGAVLLFYCFLASFSPSVIRASVMYLMGLAASSFGKEKDPFNSLCFAVTAVIAVKPLYLFDIGFQMSVAAVAGILFFSKRLNRIFLHIFPKFLSSALSSSLSAQIGITPVVLINFQTFPLYSVLVNMLVIPLVSVAFIVLTAGLIIALLFPSAGVVLTAAGLPLAVIDTIAEFTAGLPLSDIRIFAGSAFFSVFLLYFICSGFFMMKRFKFLAVIACFIISVSGLAYMNLPLSYAYDYITVDTYKSVISVIRSESATVAVGDFTSRSAVEEMMRGVRARKLGAVYVNSLSEANAAVIAEINEKYPVNAVYCPECVDYSGMYLLLKNDIPFYLFDSEFSGMNGIKPVFSSGFAGYVYTSEKASMLLLGYGASAEDVPLEVLNACALIRSYRFDGMYPKRIYIVNYENSYIDVLPEEKFVLNGPAALDIKNGRIKNIID